MKMFSVAGVARVRDGAPLKFKVANGKLENRVKVMARHLFVDIELFALPQEMTKADAFAWLKAEKPELVAKLAVKAAKAAKAPKVKVAKAPKTKAVKVAAKAVAPEVQVVDVALSPAAKLALKRVKDAARKREKRAAEKAAKAA